MTMHIGSYENQQTLCQCHDCTQARWKSSIQGQIDGALRPAPSAPQSTRFCRHGNALDSNFLCAGCVQDEAEEAEPIFVRAAAEVKAGEVYPLDAPQSTPEKCPHLVKFGHEGGMWCEACGEQLGGPVPYPTTVVTLAPQSTQTAREAWKAVVTPELKKLSRKLSFQECREFDEITANFAESYASSRVASLQQELDRVRQELAELRKNYLDIT